MATKVSKSSHFSKGDKLNSNPSIFKPLIASSLALTLGVSVAIAQPEIKYGTSGEATSTIDPSSDSLAWNGSNSTNLDSFWTLKKESGSGDPVNITFKFDQDGTGQGALSEDTYTVSLSGKATESKSPILLFQSKDHGIDMQGKALTFDFLGTNSQDPSDWNQAQGTQNPHKRKIVLDLSGTTQYTPGTVGAKEAPQKVSLKGDITIKAGKPIGEALNHKGAVEKYQNANEFEAIFGGDMIGNITINHSDVRDPNAPHYANSALEYQDLKSTFTFKDGASLQGDLISHTGDNTFIFQGGGNITGDIQATAQTDLDDNPGLNVRNKIVFESGDVSMSGKQIILDVRHYKSNIMRGADQMGSNTLVFGEKISSINLNLSELGAAGDYGTQIANRYAKNFNVLSFNNTTQRSDATIVQITKIDAYAGSNLIGKNLVTYSSSDSSNVIVYNDKFFEIDTNFQNATQLKNGIEAEFMKEEYQAKGTFTVGSGSNNDAIVTHDSNGTEGKNYLNVETLIVNGNIKSNKSGRNYLVMNTGEIKGNITMSGGGTNTIQSNGNLTIQNPSSAQTISTQWGQNLIRANTMTLGASGGSNKINLTVNGDNATGEAKNSIISKGKMTAYFGTLTASGDGSGKHTNIVTGGEGSEIHIDSLSVTASGNNSNNIAVGKDGSITVSNNITSSGGTNTLSSQGTLTLGGTITANANGNSYNFISSLGDTTLSSSSITAGSGGYEAKNLFDFGGKVTLNPSLVIKASNTTNTNTDKINIIRFGGDIAGSQRNSEVSLAELTAVSKSGDTTNNSKTKNILSFDGLSTSTTLTITDINKSTSLNSNVAGFTYIGKNITQGSGSSLALNTSFNDSNWSSEDFKASNLTLKVTNILNAKKGNIYINVGTLQTNQIINDGAANNLSATEFKNTGGIKATWGANNNIIASQSLTISGDIQATPTPDGGNYGTNTITLSGENATGEISGNITIGEGKSGQNNFNLSGNNASLTLKGKTTGGTTHQISTLTASGESTSFTLDNSSVTSEVMNTSIANPLNTPNLTITLKGGTDASKAVNLTLKGANNTIGAIALGSASSDVESHKITLENGKTTIKQGVLIESNKAMSFDLKANTELVLSGDLTNTGTTKINIAEGGGTITGSITAKDKGTTTITASGKATINGSLQAIGGSTISATNTATFDQDTTINGSLIASARTISSSDDKEGVNNITFKGSSNTITGNIITSGNGVLIGKNNITLDGENVTLNLQGDTNQITTLSLNKDSSTIEATLNLQGDTNQITTLSLNKDSSTIEATLNLQGDTNQITTLSLGGESTTSATLNIKGQSPSSNTTIDTLEVKATTNNLSLSNTTTTIKGELNNDGSKTLNLTLKDNAILELEGNTNKISSLDATQGTLLNLAMTDDNGHPRVGGDRTAKTLEIGANSGNGFKGEAAFEVYTDGQASNTDSITFKSAQKQDDSSTKSVATIVASGDINTILNGDGKTLKVAVVESGAKSNMEVVGGERLIGGVVVETTLTSTDNENYYLGKGKDKGAPIQYQEVATSALTVNYDLYLANFNSLNKRMGELRDNANSQGVWARVFGGNMSNDFGAGSKTDYVTAQAGYDYALSVGENAKNYVGVALAYGKSWTKGNALSMNGLIGASGSIALSSVDSNMVEVGIYNSYVADSGWYNDTILKFDYIMSEFALSNKSDLYTNTSNFAMVLSDEFGYRYKFGSEESWYIDPQVEMAFGYFNQSDFNRAMYDASGAYQSTMNATQDTILTLRTRAGMSLGKKFTTEKGFASIYVGAFYEYDYIDGGNASVAGRVGGTMTYLDSLESNGRAIVNVGSNIGLTKDARLYIDVEKSFGDEQRTFMQFNFGARYSF